MLINYIGIPSIVTTILSLEAERFNYQRKIQDFTTFTVTKHAKYIRLYELLLEAEARICEFYGAKSYLTYEEYDESDIRRIMTEGKFSNGKIEEIVVIG